MDRSVRHADLYPSLVSALLLIVVVLGLYGPTLGYAFVYEDLNDTERFLAPLTWQTAIDNRLDRVLTVWTFGLSAWLSPYDPWGYHLVSVAWHALNTVLLFGLARCCFVRVWPAFVCAAFFAVHPLQSEAVAYISSRADLVMTTGVLLGLLGAERSRWGLAMVGCLVAVMGKESGVVSVPLVIWWTMVRNRPLPAWVLCGSLCGFVFAVGYLGWFYSIGTTFSLQYTAQETAKLWHLVSKVFLPLNFSIDHDYGWWSSSWAPITLALTGMACTVALWSSRAWAFGVLFVVLSLSPRLLIPLVEGLHEHHLYLPFVGVSLALVGAFAQGSRDGVSETFT